MVLKATTIVLQGVTKGNAKKIRHVTEETFDLWYKHTLGRTNPLNKETLGLVDEASVSVSSLWQSIKNFFGFRKKVTPRSFSDGSHTPKGPYVASKTSVEASKRYVDSNRIGISEKVVDGFRDGGRGAKYDKWGDAIQVNREIITVDLALDKYLQRVIEHTLESTKGMNEKQKAKFLYNLITDISGDTSRSLERAHILGEKGLGKEVLLGKVFEKEAAVCRHKGLLFKILADKIGLKATMVRGNMMDFNGTGGHVWNEVIFSDGKKFIYDTQNLSIIDISKGKIDRKAAQYLDVNDRGYYI